MAQDPKPAEVTITAGGPVAGTGKNAPKQYIVLADRLVLLNATYGQGTVLSADQLPADQIQGFMDLDPPALKELK